MAGPYPPAPDTRTVGSVNPPGDNNTNSDAIAAVQAVLAACAGFPGNTSIPADNSANATAMQTLLTAGMPYLGLAPSGDDTGATDQSNFAGLVTLANYIPLQAGKFYVSETQNWKVPALVVKGAGESNTTSLGGTIIEQVTANTPIIAVAGQQQDISGFTLTYSTQQTSGQTDAICMTLSDNSVGACFLSTFHEISFLLCNTAMSIVSTEVGGCTNCTFENLHINGYSYSALNMQAAAGTGAAGATGNVWSNIYIHNNITGSDQNSAFRPVNFQGFSDNVFNQLNVEHGEVFDSDVIALTDCGSFTFNSLHFEHLEMSGDPGYGFIGIFGAAVVVNSLSIEGCTFTGTDYNSIVRFNVNPGNVIINGLNEPSGNFVDTAHPYVDFGSQTGCTAQISGVVATSVTENWVNWVAGDTLMFSNDDPSLVYGPSQAVAETFTRDRATTAVTVASGTPMMRMVRLCKGKVYTSATFVTNSNVKTGGTHGWYVLTDCNRKVLAVTADQTDASTVWGTASTPYTIDFGAAYTGTYDGWGYLGVMVAESGGSLPSFASQVSVAGGINGTVTPVLAGTSTAGETTPPMLGATMGSISSQPADNLYGYMS